ncbi:MAG: cell division protein FtsX [Alphaproteobacteria bacterium]
MIVKFLTKKSNSPFAKDTSTMFLPLMMVFMVFMATLSLGVVMAINSMTSHWNKSISGSITVQIVPSLDKKTDNIRDNVDTMETKVDTALIVLRENKNVINARALDNEEIKKLLEPWLGSADIMEDIPMPKLIDVKIKNNSPETIEEIDKNLKKHLPEAVLDDHRIWTKRLTKLVGSLKILSFIALYLIIGATVFTVVYATRTSLVVHKPVINLLHLIGAKDSYVSMQYAKRTFFLAVIGGFFGFVIAAPALMFIGSLAFNLGGGALSALNLERDEWFVIIAVPVSTAILSMLTAYFTVQRDLLRML